MESSVARDKIRIDAALPPCGSPFPLASGEEKAGRLPVGTSASGHDITIPWLAVKGERDGPCLWINAAVHGDEINGVLAALDFFRSLEPASLRGSVVVTPVSNPLAFDARRKRAPQDELDLDQTFPGKPDGLVSELIPNALFLEMRRSADVIVNFHTMNPYFDSVPYAVYKNADGGPPEQDILAAVSWFNPFCACRMPVSGGSELPGNVAGALDFQALRSGKLAFMVELGGGSRCEDAYVEQGRSGLSHLAAHLGMISGSADRQSSLRRATKRRHVMCQRGGLFRRFVGPGRILPGGQPLGVIHDVWGRTIEEIAFPADVCLLGVRNDPVVHSGDRVAFVAEAWDEFKIEWGEPK